jgi:acetylornithine/succinyldiaminopimelate/putrescine aminotransferase
VNRTHVTFSSVKTSLKDLVGEEYTGSVCGARARLTGEDRRTLEALAAKKVEFCPKALQRRLVALLPKVGAVFCSPGAVTRRGASSAAFDAHTDTGKAPIGGLGYFRVGESGRLYLTSKSEHYHVPLGHGFPGYTLVDHARRLGIPNATHNNTRGHITRLLEEEMVRTAAGLARNDRTGLDRLLRAKRMTALNRVLNLDTGSLAAEAALKMLLAQFYKPQTDSPQPKYEGRVPVFVVMGDDDGGLEANYHGTTVLTQVMRGMWPGLAGRLEEEGLFEVRSVKPNDMDGLERVFAQYDKGRKKIAGFFHELILMNYAGKRLTKAFIKRAYALCRKHDVPTVCDEIQTCVWSPELYLFREYGIKPTFVVVGKGFPGGEYAASRVLFSANMDTLSQFGALVTNGQEELASLSYLVTMRWVEANAEAIAAVGGYYEERLNDLLGKYPALLSEIQGRRHLAGVYFQDIEPAKAFAKDLNDAGLDISVQTYKAGCPPSALTKLPLIAGYEVVDFVVERMEQALGRI